MDDETFLKMAYKRKFGKELDLNNPVTFNEKLQWLGNLLFRAGTAGRKAECRKGGDRKTARRIV